MSELQKPIGRLAYQHTPSGECFIVWGCGTHLLDKKHTEEKPIVIMTNLKNGDPCYYPLEKFFDINPATNEPRFQLVTPIVPKK